MKSNNSGKGNPLMKVYNAPIEQDASIFLLMARYQACSMLLSQLGSSDARQRDAAAQASSRELEQLMDSSEKEVREDLLGDTGLLDFTGTPQELAAQMTERLREILAAELEHMILDVCEAYNEPRYLAEAHLAVLLGGILGEEDAAASGTSAAESTLVHFPVSGQRS